MAEARSAQQEPRVRFQEEDTSEIEQQTKFVKSFFQTTKECGIRIRLQIYNRLWPTTWDNLLAAWITVFSVMYINHPKLNAISYYLWSFGRLMNLDDSYPYIFRIITISLISSILYFIVVWYLRQHTLRILLSYKGWLYQPPRSQSKTVLLWGLLVRIISGRSPSLYSYQNSLPRMNVPSLKSTVSKFLESVKPVLDAEEYKEIEMNAKTFLGTIGPKLQWVLKLKSWWSKNYYADWWEKYVYLMGRDPIAINSNYYVLEPESFIATKIQTARAAGVTSLMLSFNRQIESEKLEPIVIRHTIPLCMKQYARLFGTARIPKKGQDKLQHRKGVQHIAVLCKGHFYRVSVVDAYGQEVNILDLQSQFEWIKRDAEKQQTDSEAELRIAALTSINRNKWAEIQANHFSIGINRDSVKIIQDSLFLVVLDDKKCFDVNERGKHLFHGDGASIWFDKSLTLIIFADGKFGFNCEHSWADALVASHLMEQIMLDEYLYNLYDNDGYAKPFVHHNSAKRLIKESKALITPMRLYWDINDDLATSINESYYLSLKSIDDLDLFIRGHESFGKGFIKTTKMSPDAFIQIALQLAYYKDSDGKFVMTYEASMTRLFLHGRTETVRSLTQEIKDFVLAMNDENCSKKERKELIKRAADKHQKSYRDCMSGKGCDRHLFSLYIVARGQGHDIPFLKSALTMPWTLSTSQQTQHQVERWMDTNLPHSKDLVSPGGGFGPVSDQGYGVSYMVAGEDTIFFHVSSKRSCEKTDSEKFMQNIFWALNELRNLFNDDQKDRIRNSKKAL